MIGVRVTGIDLELELELAKIGTLCLLVHLPLLVFAEHALVVLMKLQ